ncbi:WD repeat-containing protein 35, partial [Diaphorina citri]|uniref:WD repeat-containing protein 35 n=1 Tax=Diaphorina citri TaxID=121845 RepID=A0A3Q0IRV8_DIACI
MFIYLSKKIAIPNNTKVNCLAWHQNQGWIAVGGDDGLLKVLKLDTGKESTGQVAAANVNLAMNQSLQGHSGKVRAIIWNEQYEKLTSSDETGLIIVWMLYKVGSLFLSLCLCSKFIWGWYFPPISTSAILYSSGSQTFLHGASFGHILIFSHPPPLPHSGGGRNYQTTGYTDDKPIVVNVNMRIGCCEWNEDGTIVAVAGTTKLQGDTKQSNVVQFFSSQGEHIRSLKLPGSELSSCAWGPGSLRIALSIDSFIYFANIRPYYLWTYFGDTLVFSSNQGLLFWDTVNNTCHVKSVPNIIALCSYYNVTSFHSALIDMCCSNDIYMYFPSGNIDSVARSQQRPLVLAFTSGCIQFMRSYTDDKPIVVNVNMRIGCCEWNEDGTIVAVAGTTKLQGDTKQSNVVQFFSSQGENLEIKTVLLDEVQQLTAHQNMGTLAESEHHITHYMTTLHAKALRDTQQLLDSVGLNEAFQFVEAHPHPRLWKLLADKSLDLLSLNHAEQALVNCQDYAGLQLIKSLRALPDDIMKHAYIAQHQGRFQTAENYQLQADRRDLAIAMREKTEDYVKVLNLLKIGRGASDADTNAIFQNIGDKYAEKCQWSQAREYYEKCHCYEKLISVYTELGDFEALESCARKLPDSSPLLKPMGEIFVKYGLCEQAVYVFDKAGLGSLAVEACVRLNQWDIATEYARRNNLMGQAGLGSLAVEACVRLNQWDIATEYARRNNLMGQVGKLLEQYTQSLLEQGLRLEVVQLFKATEKRFNAARLMFEYHFCMLAQRQLLMDKPEWALSSGLTLRQFEDILSSEQIYSIIALAAIKSRAFGTASKAFMKLEAISE